MTENTNQIAVANEDVTIVGALEIVQETKDYAIVKDANGKHKRVGKYEFWSSFKPETREEKVNMHNLLNSDEVAQPLGEHIGAQFEIAAVIFNPYDKIDEDTGNREFGVLTYLITPENVAYVTSSKSVHYSTKEIFKVFGTPEVWAEEGYPVVKAVKKKGQQFQYTDIKLIG